MLECNGRHLIPVWILLRCVVALSGSLAVYLYSASGSLFIEDVLLNRIAEKLRISFSDQMNRKVSPGELNAWRNSLQSFAHVLSHFQLTNVGVVLEMQLPLTSKRLRSEERHVGKES